MKVKGSVQLGRFTMRRIRREEVQYVQRRCARRGDDELLADTAVVQDEIDFRVARGTDLFTSDVGKHRMLLGIVVAIDDIVAVLRQFVIMCGDIAQLAARCNAISNFAEESTVVIGAVFPELVANLQVGQSVVEDEASINQFASLPKAYVGTAFHKENSLPMKVPISKPSLISGVLVSIDTVAIESTVLVRSFVFARQQVRIDGVNRRRHLSVSALNDRAAPNATLE